MIFVQLISCLLPFLYSVLEWCNQAFHKSTAVTERYNMRVENKENDIYIYFNGTKACGERVAGWEQGQQRWNGILKHNPLKEKKKRKMALKRQNTGDTYLVKWRNFASMLRCRIHILVRAEPTSLVAPWTRQTKQIVVLSIGTTDHSCSCRHRTTVEQQYDCAWGQISKSGERFEKSNSLLSDGYFLPEMCFMQQPLDGKVLTGKDRALKCHLCLGKAKQGTVLSN